MTAAGPWSVKGIDPKAREIAKDLARRSGMTLGEWLNQMIIEGGEPDAPPYEAQGEPLRRRQLDELYREAQAPRRSVVPEINPAAEAAEAARVARALANLSVRMEAAEHRSTLAISGVDQSVMGVISRLDELERDRNTGVSGVSAALERLNTVQAGAAERLQRLEQDDGARTEALRAVQSALDRVGGQLQDNGAQAKAATEDVKVALDGLAGRLERTEQAIAGVPDAYADAEKVETVLTRMAERLDDAEVRTGLAVKSLETSFAGLDARIRAAEVRGGANEDMERRFQDLAAELSRKVETSRADLVQRLRAAAGGRLDTMERALTAIGGQIEQAERRSAQAIDHVGREVMRVARNLNEKVAAAEATLGVQADRLADVETRSATALETVGGEVARIADTIDARMHQIDGAQAEALEKLGSEIARIAERLSERIAASDRRAAEALDGVSDTVSRISDRIDQRQAHNASELTDRIRESEARTAKLLEAARGRLELLSGGAVSSVEPAGMADQDHFQTPSGFEAHAPAAYGPDPYAPDAYAPEAYAPEAYALDAGSPATGSHAASAATVAPAHDPVAQPVSHAFASDPFAERDDDFFEASPFNPNDDFAPAEPAVHASAAEPSAPDPAPAPLPPYEPFAFAPAPFPESPEPPPFSDPVFGHPLAAEPVFGAADPHDAEPDSPPAMSTREMLDAARQAARRAAAGARHEPPAAGGAPTGPLEPLPRGPRAFGIGFPARRKKEPAPTLRTAVLASVTAGALTTAAVGAYMLGGTVHDGPSVADPVAAPSAIAPATPNRSPQAPASTGPADADANATPPNLAVALAPSTPEHAAAKAVAAARKRAESAATTPPGAAEPTPKALYTIALQRLQGGDLTAISEMRRAADLGQPDAQFHLARMYEAGDAGLPRDVAEARRWTQRAAQNGQPEAMYNMASYAYAGDGGAKDLPAAVSWFRAAAEHGVVNGQYNLAQLYEKGFGVPQSPSEAYKWYLAAAASGDSGAKAAAAALKAKLSPAAQVQAEMSAAALTARIASPVRTASVAP